MMASINLLATPITTTNDSLDDENEENSSKDRGDIFATSPASEVEAEAATSLLHQSCTTTTAKADRKVSNSVGVR